MAKLLSIIFVSLCLIGTLNSSPITKSRPLSFLKNKKADNYRLPTNTEPKNYTVHLTTRVDKNEDDFTGEVTIDLVTNEDTDFITIHKNKGLEIKNYEIICGDKNIEDPTDEYVEETEQLTFSLKEKFEKGTECELTIEYMGKLRDDNRGFYKSFYEDKDGNKRYLATTQFEATEARHAFPCYDEPGLRATFNISITYGGEGYHALSNTPIIAKETNEAEQTTTVFFDTTPVMQPYIIAFIISDYTAEEIKQKEDEVIQKVYARPEAIAGGEGKYALQTGIEVLKEQEKYFGIPFELSKMDQVSIPDFTWGAMENWGLVTYRETALLYNEDLHSLNYKRRIAGIIAHEFAHQWFGNLVAPEWWKYIWLNEGFANYYGFYTTSQLYKEFSEMGFFIFENLQNALESDALPTTRPMTHDAEDPVSIMKLFDDIAYDKSGSVLRMIQHALTEDVFKKALYYYLTENAYKSANPDRLAEALQKAVDEVADFPEEIKMKDLIDSWSLKAGYPLIEVSRDDNNNITFKQSKFSYKVEKDDDSTWIIPINMATASSPSFDDTEPVIWLTKESETIQPVEPEPEPEAFSWTTDDWIVVNIQQTGFYRVKYDDRLLNQISTKLKSDKFDEIHEYNRAQLVDDILNLARADMKDYGSTFRFLEYLSRERSFVPWSSASSGFAYLQRQLLGTQTANYFNRFVRDLVSPLFDELGITDGEGEEGLDVKHARIVGINWACGTGNEKCISETKASVKKVIDDPEQEIEANVRSVVYCNGLREASEEDYNKILERLQNEKDQGERTILINALGCIQNSDIQKTYLETSIADENPYRQQERHLVLQAVYSNGQTGLENSIDFVNEHYEKIDDTYDGISPLKGIIPRMSERVTSEGLNQKFEEMMTTLTTAKYFTEEEKDKILETPQENLEWIVANEGEIRSFFTEYYKDAATVPLVSTLFLGVLLVIGYLLQ